MDGNGDERIEWSFADYGSGAFHIVSARRAPEPDSAIAPVQTHSLRRLERQAAPGLLCRLAAALRFERCAA